MGGRGLPVGAGAFWSGILLAGTLGSAPVAVWAAVLLTGAAGLWVAAVVRREGRWWRAAFLAAVFVLLGAGWGGLRAEAVASSPLARLAGRSVELTGTIATEPRDGALGWTASIAVAQVEPELHGWPAVLAVHGSVWADGRGRPPRLDVGDRVVVTGLLERPGGPFGQFLRERGYPAELSVSTMRYRGAPTSPVVRAADRLRAALRGSLSRVFPPREAGLLMGLTLGDTSRLDPVVGERFKATGLTHLLAVSGENVAMFLAPILGLAGLLRLGRRGTLCVGLFAVAFFAVLTRAEPSVLRAAAMASLAMLGSFLGRPRSAAALMGGAVLLLLAFDPTLVYAVGFQLSVAATAGIAALAGPLAQRMRWMPRWLAMAAGTTLGAQAGVTPLLLHYFGAVPTVTVAANLLAAPAVGPGMLLGLAAAAVGVAWHDGGVAIAWAARIPIRYLEGLATHLARWPLPSLTSSGKRMWQLVPELALLAALVWWLRSARRLTPRGVASIVVALALFASGNAFAAGRPRALTVTFFDVGEGDAALVRSPGGASILIDGGPDPEQVATKLAAAGVHRLDMIVATHPHLDHYEGLAAVLARVPTGVVLDTGCRPDESRAPPYLAFLRSVRAAGVPERHAATGDGFVVGDVRIDVLSPDRCWRGTNSDANNDSLVLLVRGGDGRVLFANEPEAAAQQAMLDAGLPITAPVLNVPHHGAATSIRPFLQAVHAVVAVVSVGPNSYGHPAPTTIGALRAAGARVFRTDVDGDVTVTFEPGGGVSVESSHDG